MLFRSLWLALNLQAQSPALMPMPASMTLGPGRFTLDASFRMTVKADAKDTILYAAANRTFQALNRRTGLVFKQQRVTPTDTRTDASLVVNAERKAEPAIGADESYSLFVSPKGITINGLVILSDRPMAWNPEYTNPQGGLPNYFRTNVIGGPGAFMIVAENFGAFTGAILSKLIREIAGEPVDTSLAQR